MISYNEALSVIKEEFRNLRLKTEIISLPSSLNRVLSQDVITDINLPPFDNSAMDGYAVAYNENITQWSVKGEISAGNYYEFNSHPGEAVAIMTGAKIPAGYDTVIPVEDIIVNRENILLKPGTVYKRGLNIRNAGEDIKAGEIIIKKNTLITPKEIAGLASAGKWETEVFRRIKIGIFTTGDELVDIRIKPEEDQIRASNLYSLLAAVAQINMDPVNLGIHKDNREAIKQSIESALKSDIDILITTGGVSAGKYDLLKEIFIESGVDIRFHKVNIKPGKPVLFGVYKNEESFKLVFGLPGNPVSALVGFIIFITEGLSSVLNIKKNNMIPAELGADIKKTDNRLHFAAGNISLTGNKFIVYPGKSTSSGNSAQMAASDCLILIEENVINPRKGDQVNCIMI